MRIERKRIPTLKDKDVSLLADLAVGLCLILHGRKLGQSAIEDATGVDQTTISRAKNGKLKRVTENVRRLKIYADMQKLAPVVPGEITAAASTFLAAGGSEEELISSIRLATRMVLRHPVSTDM